MKGLISFLALVVAPLIFWIGEKGLTLRQEGYWWVPFVTAPVFSAIFAFIVSGAPGKKLVGQDDQGNWLLGRFWAVFILLTVAQLAIAIGLKLEQ